MEIKSFFPAAGLGSGSVQKSRPASKRNRALFILGFCCPANVMIFKGDVFIGVFDVCGAVLVENIVGKAEGMSQTNNFQF